MSHTNCEFTAFTVRVRLTQEHISRGKAKSVNACPIALAIRDALPVMNQNGDCFLSVGPQAADIPLKVPGVGWVLHWYRHFGCELPESAQKFIREFDAGNVTQSFEFDLTLKQDGRYV